MWTRVVVTVVLGMFVAAPHPSAQNTSLRAERTVEFRTGRALEINAKAGPVLVSSVEFTDLGKSGSSGITKILRPPAGTGSEVSTTLRAHFIVENPTADEWEVAFTLDFLDKNGAVIERVTKRSSWEGESKPFDFDHQILSYVVPIVARVRVRMEARLD